MAADRAVRNAVLTKRLFDQLQESNQRVTLSRITAVRGSRLHLGRVGVSEALGIGINAAIFSVMNALMFKPLPVRDPRQLVEIREGTRRDAFSNPVWEQIRDQRGLFD